MFHFSIALLTFYIVSILNFSHSSRYGISLQFPLHLTPQVGSTPRPRPEDLVASPPETHVFLAPGLCFLPKAPGAPQGNPRGGQVVPARPRQLPSELHELCGSLVHPCPPLLTLTAS